MACVPVAAQQATRKLSLTEAIEIAKRESYAAQVARYSFLGQYWNYRSYRAELLPSLNLSGGVMNFDRSIVEVRDADSGRVNYVDNNSLSNDLTLSVDQNIPFLGGTLSLQSSLSRLDQFSYDEKTYNSFFEGIVSTRDLQANVNQELCPTYGDRVIILSTCLISNRLNRYLVMGVLTDETPLTQS